MLNLLILINLEKRKIGKSKNIKSKNNLMIYIKIRINTKNIYEQHIFNLLRYKYILKN
jgi:hypothetical protein